MAGDLTQTLMQHDLIDEYHFIVNPVIVGSGKRLFKTGNDKGFKTDRNNNDQFRCRYSFLSAGEKNNY